MSYSTTSYASATICAPQVTSYPFINTPQADTNAKIVSREYVQEMANYAPLPLGNTQTLPADGVWGANNSAYLVEQSDPVLFSGTLCKFIRKWATVPADQVSYSTIVINKPNPTSYATANGSTVDSPPIPYCLYSTALFLSTQPVFALVNAKATFPGGGIANVTANGHGITANVNVVLSALYVGNYVAQVIPAANVSIVNSNFVSLSGVSSNTAILNGTNAVGPQSRIYTPGTDRVRVKRTQSFYLPNVTANISSPTDIPTPDPATNDETLLGLVIAYSSGYQVYDAEALQPWIGQIYTQTKIEIDMANL